jgi:hypothetical protein
MHIPIGSGCRVLVELVESTGEVDRRVFTIVSPQQADFKTGLLDESAPLARALMGHFAGQTLPYRVGGLKEVRILEVKSLGGPVSSDAAEQRRADVKSAEAQSEITSQMIFAGARGSKWGEYDVDIEKFFEEEKKRNEENKNDNEKRP